MKKEQTKEQPQDIQFTETEKLKMENIQLKVSMTRQEMVRLEQEQRAIGAEIEKRLGIDSLQNYLINVQQGIGKRNTDKNK